MKKKYAAAIAYNHGHEDGYESGYEHGRASMRMTDVNRRLLVSTLEAFCTTQDVSMDAVISEVLDYARKAS